MFSKKLQKLDTNVKSSFSCCCFGSRTESPPSDEERCKKKGSKSNSRNKSDGKKEYGSLDANKESSDKVDGAYPETKKKEEKVKNGAAYAYDDSDSSSDSDDEVLKQFQSTLKPRNSIQRSDTRSSIKRSDTSQSIRSSKSLRGAKTPTLLDEKFTSRTSLVREVQTPRDSSCDESEPYAVIDKSINQNANQDDVKVNLDHPGSPETSTASVSMHGSQQQLIYENRAFTDEVMSGSGSDHLSLAGAMSTDEHLFDVSDLDKEPVLISKCGSLEMTFSYDPGRSRMAITIHQAQDIPAKDRGGASNCQVRILLLPTKKQRYKTKVKTGESPSFNENFVFSKIPPEEVHGMGIRIRLYGLERMRRERMIGESIIGFASLNLDMTSTHWIILEPRSNLSGGDSKFDVSSLSRSDSASSTQSMQHGGMPELLLGLAYNGTTGRLSVEVIKGSNFRNMAMNRAPDTYVKLTLMSPTGQEVARSKTSIRRGQPNPLFKETFMFQVALFQLAEVTLMVSVYNKRSMKKKDMIGWFSLGLNCSGEEEESHWGDMRESKGEQVCRWHVLLES